MERGLNGACAATGAGDMSCESAGSETVDAVDGGERHVGNG